MTLIKNTYGGNRSFTPNYECPYCGNKMKFSKLPSICICSRCKKVFDGSEIIKIDI